MERGWADQNKNPIPLPVSNASPCERLEVEVTAFSRSGLVLRDLARGDDFPYRERHGLFPFSPFAASTDGCRGRARPLRAFR